MRFNIFQWGVIHGLGWVVCLTDGWLIHNNFLFGVGLFLILFSTWRMGVEIKRTPEDEAFDDIERRQRDSELWRKRQIASTKPGVDSFDEWGHSHRPEQYWVERRAYLAGFDAGARGERLRKELND
jgi:hypothetical protein